MALAPEANRERLEGVLLVMEARSTPLRPDELLMKRAPADVRKRIRAHMRKEARMAAIAREIAIDRATREAQRASIEAYLAAPSPPHMDIVCVQSGKVLRFRLSKQDRAKRRAQDKAARRRPKRLRGA